MIDKVAAVAAEAAAMALGRVGQVRSWEKSPGQPVCDADIDADRLIRARLTAIDPDAGWLSEETVDDAIRLDRRRLWIVDPIDGTRDYLRGRPGWAVSIALVADGEVVLGVLDAPARTEQWRATKGGGATRNGERVVASGRTSLPGARVATDALPKADRDLVAVPRPNSIALRMAMVAADEADLLATLRWGHEWDIAAAALIVTEAGGVVTDALGQPLRFNSARGGAFGVMAAAAGIHEAAVERLGPRARDAMARG
nr:3'(2'),5'-bisphosphate nucleotidase CysQ [Sphingomonas jejuensis]